MKLYPIQTTNTTNIGFLQGTSRFTDCDKLGEAINEKINATIGRTGTTYVHVANKHICTSEEEKQQRWDKTNPTQDSRYTSACFIIGPKEDYHMLLPILIELHEAKKKNSFPLDQKYAFILSADTKCFRGN